MSKGIKLTQSQIKAYENGATKFIFPIKNYGFTQYEINEFNEITCSNCGHIMYASDKHICPNCEGSMCYKNLPIQKGDKDIFIKEEFRIPYDHKILYKADNWVCLTGEHNIEWKLPNEMTKEQSRYSFGECIDVKVIRVQDIEWVMGYHFQRFYNRCMQERNINRTYEDNDYVFSVEFK